MGHNLNEIMDTVKYISITQARKFVKTQGKGMLTVEYYYDRHTKQKRWYLIRTSNRERLFRTPSSAQSAFSLSLKEESEGVSFTQKYYSIR